MHSIIAHTVKVCIWKTNTHIVSGLQLWIGLVTMLMTWLECRYSFAATMVRYSRCCMHAYVYTSVCIAYLSTRENASAPHGGKKKR